eukprot:748879-Ditylum_brightwellii.AAC.1
MLKQDNSVGAGKGGSRRKKRKNHATKIQFTIAQNGDSQLQNVRLLIKSDDENSESDNNSPLLSKKGVKAKKVVQPNKSNDQIT